MDTETKRHIDAARQVLVGVVPNPTSQIDQITYALIYKFMDDMDQAAIKNGDEPNFFVGDLEPYSWARLMDSRVGNQDRMNLYVIAFQKFAEAKQLPELFRNILKSAFLPYRSPETLGLFLKEIDYFNYSHPEELGNAYEYLLSIMSSQGDAGQFRTPRHIIDFIVNVVNPTQDDKVLDPACGTGGFLVKSYQHILEQHDGKNDPDKKEKPLTPDQRKNLMNNFEGYDIDPGMVRIAQVNMYLHQFKNPKIFQYDTLSSEERWNDKFDVIMANPPFMSPKGGIKPHSKFSIQSSRSEVLFVDYIMNHLRPKGRAGIIVPEGIIFQSGTAYKQLRKNLIEDGLYAVVSLPSGVFAPYSGVKTSILFFDNELAKQKQEILFVKIENDGLDLGATKRPINKNDLPQAIKILKQWQQGTNAKPLLDGLLTENGDNLVSETGSKILLEQQLAFPINKKKIAENDDYNLSGDHYRVATDYSNAKWPMVELHKVSEIVSGSGFPTDYQGKTTGSIPFLKVSDMNLIGNEVYIKNFNNSVSEEVLKTIKGKVRPIGTIIFPKIGAAIATNKKRILSKDSAFDNNVMGIIPTENVIGKYIYYLLLNFNLSNWASDSALPSMRQSVVEKELIPLPPLEVQKQIVTELDGYSGIIAGAKQINQNWKPKIEIDPEWEKVKLGEVCVFENGDRGVNYPSKSNRVENGIPFINAGHLTDDGIDMKNMDYISRERFDLLGGGKVQKGDILFCLRGSLGKYAKIESFSEGAIASSLVIIRPKKDVIADFLMAYFGSSVFADMILGSKNGVAQPNLAAGSVKNFEIPLPPLATQKQIVEKIEAERTLVESSKKLIEIYDQKTKETIAKLWEE